MRHARLVALALALVLALAATLLVPSPALAVTGAGPGITAGTVVRQGNVWHLRPLFGGGEVTSVRFGRGDDHALLCDADGDGVRAPVVVRDAVWFVRDGLDPDAPVTTFRYGRPGDRAVCGDFDGDGRETAGVVRDSWWYLRDGPGGGAGDHAFFYGRRGDEPVVGDWDGDGTDTAGIVRDGTWHLKLDLAPGPADRSFRYGTATDQAVAGDWNGDGTDTVGVVRAGSWLLREGEGGGPADRRLRFGAAASEPLVWRSKTGGLSCPTGSVVAQDPRTHVRPPDARLLDADGPADADAQALRRVLGTTHRYLLNDSYDIRYARRARFHNVDLLGDAPRTEHAIRRPAMEAFSLAVALRTGAYQAATVGRSREFAADHARWLVRSLGCQHLATTEEGWGNEWQSALWTHLAGAAGWLLWDDLSGDERLSVARMVEHEANRFLEYDAPYWYDRNGREVFAGDTKAEENTWNANLLQLAVAMMPEHPNAGRWQHRNVQLLVSAFATPSDLDNETVVNGRAVADWVDGWNASEDGTLENHGRVNPDYMTSTHQAWGAALTATLAGRPTPEAAFHNGELVYGAPTTVDFDTAAGYTAPGGTMFAGEDLYYPQGDSWGRVRRINFLTQDVMAEVYGLDARRERGATYWKRLRLRQQLDLQARFDDGRSYTGHEEFRYPGREEYTAQMAAMASLTVHLAAQAPLELDTADYSRPERVGEDDPDAEAPDPEPDEDDEDVSP